MPQSPPCESAVIAIDLGEAVTGRVRAFLLRYKLRVRLLPIDEQFSWDGVCGVVTGTLEGVRRARAAGRGGPVLLIAESTSKELAIAALCAGASDFLSEPLTADELAPALFGRPGVGRKTSADPMIGD